MNIANEENFLTWQVFGPTTPHLHTTWWHTIVSIIFITGQLRYAVGQMKSHTTTTPMLGRDYSSYDCPMSPLVWTHPQGTHRLGPTNPQLMSIDLYTTLDQFHYFPKPYGFRKITYQVLYSSPQPNILLMWDLPYMWSISNSQCLNPKDCDQLHEPINQFQWSFPNEYLYPNLPIPSPSHPCSWFYVRATWSTRGTL